MMGVLSRPRPGQNRRYAYGFASILARNTSQVGYPNHTHFIGQTRNSGIRVMVSAAHHRSSTAFCVTNRAARSRSRFSPDSCTTTRRCPPRSRSSSSVFTFRAWSWSLTAGWSPRPTCRRSRTPRGSSGSRRGATGLREILSGASDHALTLARRHRRSAVIPISTVARDALQPRSLHEQNLAEITAEDYPGERLIVCRNPLVAAERTRKRSELLEATERDLKQIADRVQKGTLTGASEIGLAVGPAVKHYKMRKHFDLHITDHSFTFKRKTEQINNEAALDGIYILRTGLTKNECSTSKVVRSYKNLEQAERAFKTFKGPELQIRPIHHHLETRVRAHIFLCMLAYYLTWHLKAAWAPLTFKDENPPVPVDPVAKAARSTGAKRKAQTKHTTTGQPCHSYKSLLSELATLTRNTIRLPETNATFKKLTEPTPLQAHALDLAATAPITT